MPTKLTHSTVNFPKFVVIDLSSEDVVYSSVSQSDAIKYAATYSRSYGNPPCQVCDRSRLAYVEQMPTYTRRR